MSAAQPEIAFIGLGRMGAPMAGRLMQAGRSVIGFDPSPTAASELVGDRWTRAQTAESAVAEVSTVILMLPNSAVVDATVGKLLSAKALAPGATVVDMSSSDPVHTLALAEALESAGTRLVDAPVSGGVTGARNGALTIMVGGDEAAISSISPILEVLGQKVTHVGAVGAGHAVKAINNLMSAAHLLASSEALLTARAFGLDLSVVLEAVNGSSGRSGSTEVKWPRFIQPETYDSGFAMALMVKDMGIARGLSRSLGVPSRLSDRAVELWSDALRDLGDDADHTEIARWLIEEAATAGESTGGPSGPSSARG